MYDDLGEGNRHYQHACHAKDAQCNLPLLIPPIIGVGGEVEAQHADASFWDFEDCARLTLTVGALDLPLDPLLVL